MPDLSQYLTIAQASTELGCRAPLLSDLLYRGYLDTARCPLMGTRRLIPRDYLPEIRAYLAARRKRTDRRVPA